MDAYIAYQPICNRYRQITGHELLYRDGSGNAARIPDNGPIADAATRKVVVDAFTLFRLQDETAGLLAINFTPNLILDDFVRKVNPDEVVVQLMGKVRINEALEAKLVALRNANYIIALKNYTGQAYLRPYLSLFDIIRVNFKDTNSVFQREVVRKHGTPETIFMADRIEREQDFDAARNMGYGLFQGYYLYKPEVRRTKIPPLIETAYGKILLSLSKILTHNNEWWVECARIIEADTMLSYLFPREATVLPPPPRRIIQNRVIWLCILQYIVCNPIICAAGSVWPSCDTGTSPETTACPDAPSSAECSWMNSRQSQNWLRIPATGAYFCSASSA